MNNLSIAIVGFLILSIAVPQVFADTADEDIPNCKLGGCTAEDLEKFKLLPLAISTDKANYDAGDAIIISGILQDNITPGYQVALMVVSPIGNIVSIAQLSPDNDNKFSEIIRSGEGGVWKESGTYTVEAKYNNMKADTHFDFDSGIIKETPSISTGASVEEENITVSVDGEIFSVKYSIENGTVTAAYIDIETKSLIIVIDSSDDGVITLTLPNSLITSDEYGYFILVDGEEADNYDESSTSSSTTLIIPFGAGTEQIEIIGSWVVPEFGAIAGLVLAVAIISIIVLSAKTRMNIIPKI